MCCNTLLPASYTQGSDAGTLICTHHTTGCSQSDVSQQDGSAENQTKCQFQEALSLSGLAISSVPRYSRDTVSLDGLVCEAAGMEGTSTEARRGESRDPAAGAKRSVKKAVAPPPPVHQTDVPDKAEEEAAPAHVPEVAKTPNRAEGVVSPRETATEGNKHPVPAPRRRLSSSVAPLPAPRTRTSQPANRSTAAGEEFYCFIFGDLAYLFLLCTHVLSSLSWLTIELFIFAHFLCTGSSSNQSPCSPTSCHM